MEQMQTFDVVLTGDELEHQLAEEHRTEMQHLETELSMLSDCFNEIADLLGQQAERLDDANAGMQNASDNIATGTDELDDAHQLHALRGIKWSVKGILAFSGVTLGGAGLFIVSPIAGSIVAATGLVGVAGMSIVSRMPLFS